MTCPDCGKQVTACISAAEGMVVRAWWCRACNWSGRAIGRERLLRMDALAELTALGQEMGNY